MKLNIRIIIGGIIIKYPRIKHICNCRYFSWRMHNWYLIDNSKWTGFSHLGILTILNYICKSLLNGLNLI